MSLSLGRHFKNYITGHLSHFYLLFKGFMETFVGLGASFGPAFGGVLYTVSNTTISGTTNAKEKQRRSLSYSLYSVIQ